MEVFPSNLLYVFPIDVRSEWKTRVTDFESGKEQRRAVWSFPKRRVTLNFRVMTESEMKDLWKFYRDHKGPYSAFWFFLPTRDYWYGEYVGKGNGSQTTFDLPSKDTTEASVTVYVDGTSVDFTFSSGGGQGGADRVTLSVAPDSGEVVTADFYGKLRLKARFAEDNLTKELFNVKLFNAQFDIVEVKEA